MQLAISGQHLAVTPALRNYVHTRFEKIERHLPRVERASIVLHQDPDRSWVEATLPVTGRVLHAHASGMDVYAAIDALAHKIDKRARRWSKRKLGRHHNAKDPALKIL